VKRGMSLLCTRLVVVLSWWRLSCGPLVDRMVPLFGDGRKVRSHNRLAAEDQSGSKPYEHEHMHCARHEAGPL
jgi:hypothetical protein